MPFLDQVASAAAPWADFYNASRAVQAVTMFGHLGGMMAGGGAALHADRATLRLRSEAEALPLHLADLRRTHPVVLASLALMGLTGLAMWLADLENLAVAPVFWIKMGMVVLLLLNGADMHRLEGRLAKGEPRPGRDWARLRHAAARSLGLWFALVLLGSLLPIFV
jgi:hypothetical protein